MMCLRMGHTNLSADEDRTTVDSEEAAPVDDDADDDAEPNGK